MDFEQCTKVELNENFGKRIIVDHKLVRKYGEKSAKFWAKENLSTQFEVMIIGQRTLSDGVYHTSGYAEDYESYYEAKSYFKALLVVADMKTNPFYVIAEC